MAYLITEDPHFSLDFFSKEDPCKKIGYKAFADSRQIVSFDEPGFKTSRKRFLDEVIKPVFEISGGKIMLGRHFVFKVSDIKALLEASCDCDYLHIHNRLDDHGYNKMVVVPYKSTNEAGEEKRTQTETLGKMTLLVEGLPCPPHPTCPFI